MPPRKIATLSLRSDPRVKDAVKQAAALEHRSIANLIEVLIRDHCKHAGIIIPEQQALFKDDDGREDT